MSHRTQTVVRHWIDLDEREQFDIQTHGGLPLRVVSLYAEVVDGSLSSVSAGCRRLRKSGELGALHNAYLYRGRGGYQEAKVVLRARGIRMPEDRRAS